MKKLFTILLLLTVITVSAQKATNYWDGSFNSYWHNDNNWSLGHIPTSAEDVVIPNGMPRYPSVDFYDEEIKSLTIQSNAEVRIYDQTLDVIGDVNVYGELRLLDGVAEIECDNITWHSGSEAQTTGDCEIIVYGTWEFAAGANVQLDNGRVKFLGTDNQYIRSKDADCYFNNVYPVKSGGIFGLSAQSTAPCKIKGYFTLGGSNYDFTSPSGQTIQIGYYFQNGNASINTALDNGTIEFTGNTSNCAFYPQPGDYFNNLIVNTGAYDLDLGTINTTSFEIKNDVTINSGRLDVVDMDLLVGGDWDNNVGSYGFWERDQKVTFNGSGHQYCSDETFHTLEVNKSGGAFRMNGTHVECAVYDWIAGAVDVLSGSFTANDLLDNAIQGIFYLNPGGVINLHNPGGYIDLKGDLYIYGGEFNVYGGSIASYWPYNEDASITMSDGVLDIKEQGIQIYNTSYALNDNITGGRIKCAGYLYNDRVDFTPNAGGFEMYGPTNANVRCSNGGRFWDLVIDKVDGGKDVGVKPFTDRNGTYYDGSRGNTATAVSNILCQAHLYIDNGTFDLGAYDFTANGSALVYGSLIMNNAANDFTVNWDMQWRPGATADINHGNFWVKGNWDFAPDINVQLGVGNTVHLNGTNVQFLYSNDADSHIGNLSIDNTSSPVWMHSTSTQPLHVAGAMTVPSGATFQIQGKSLVVDGELDIQDGATMYLSSSGGGQLTNNSDMELSGNLLVGSGEVLIHGMFDLMLTGSLAINGGNFINDGSSITNANHIFGELTMTDGLYQAEESIYICSTAITNISGGTFKCRGFLAKEAVNFQPTGGTVELNGFNDAALNWIQCSEGNYFNDLNINANANSGAILHSDITVQNNLTITSGNLWLSTYEATVDNRVDIYGRLIMTEPSASLKCYVISWYPGSTDIINNGDIFCDFWTFEEGTDAMLEAENTVHVWFGIVNYDPDAEFGHLIWEDWDVSKSNNVAAYHKSAVLPERASENETALVNNENQISNPLENGKTSYPRKVSGNCTWMPDANWSHWESLIVQGTTDITPGTSVTLENLITLTTYSDFTLNGTLNLEYGGCFVDGHFEIATTGELIIEGGEFIVENSSNSYNDIFGALTMSDGLFRIDGNIRFQPSGIGNISGGMIRSVGFIAPNSGTFEPVGGTVEIQTLNNGFGPVNCANGNHFINLNINYAGSGGGAHLDSDIHILNNLNILKGYLTFDGYTATVDENTLVETGGLMMDEPTDVLNTGTGSGNEIRWTSDAFLRYNENGRINVFGNCIFEAGVSDSIAPDQTMTFMGADDQDFENHSTAMFGTIELDKPSGALIIPSGSTVECQSYDWTSGTLTVQGGSFTAVDLADYILEGTINLNGGLIDFTQDIGQNTAMEGNLTITDGTFNLRGGAWDCKLAMTGALFLNMTGGILDFIDNGVDISSTLLVMNMTGGTIRTNENFKNINPGFLCDGGNVELYGMGKTLSSTGGYFNDLYINGIYSCGTDLDIHGDLFVNNTFTLEGTETTCMGNVEIDYGELVLNSGSTLRLDNNSAVLVKFYGYFTSNGTEGEMNLVTAESAGDRYHFTVESFGTIEAEHTIFEHMSANGIYMSEGANFLDQGFYGCTFRNGAEGGTLLTLNNTYSADIIGAVFENSTDGAAFNVTKTNDQGEFTFTNYSGNFSGQPFENDPYNRIHWYVPGLTVTPLIKNVDAPAGTTNFNVISNVDWTVSETAEWLSVNPLSSSGNGWITATFDENTSTSARSATITVSSEGLSDVIVTLNQAGAVPVLTVTPSNQNVGATAGSTTFSIVSNTTWSTSETLEWLSIYPPYGTGNGALNASFTQNNTGMERVGEITVTTDGKVAVVVTVTQDGNLPELTADPGFFDFLAPNGIAMLNVYSNTNWIISDDMDWLGLNYEFPSGNQVAEVSVQMNNTGAVRTGEITVETEDGSIEIIIPVTQQPFVEHIISLPAGWSGMSSYALPTPPFIEDVFSGISDELIIALTEEDIYYPEYGINTIGMWGDFSAYKIKTSAAVDLEIYGSAYPSKTMTIPAGWSLLPVISECEVDLEMLLDAVVDDVVMVKDVAGYGVFWPAMGINTIGTLQPGRAYYVMMSNAADIEFPDCGSLKGQTSSGVKEQQIPAGFEIASTPSTHTIAIQPEAVKDFEPGSIIAAYDQNGNCFGATQIANDINYITIFGDDPTTAEKDGFFEGEILFFKTGFEETLSVRTGLNPTFDNSLPQSDGAFTENGLSAITDFKEATGISENSFDHAVNIYPNPSSGKFSISGLPAGARVIISDMQGVVKYTLEETGTTNLHIVLDHCPAGVYLISVEYQNENSFYKLILQ
ncbi:MAG: T9SS type A sorting domain-containing protein [Bacteroidales bacterium]|nr:T9SS type A sorting domain-containing protein [Bacteroidales bacterium]